MARKAAAAGDGQVVVFKAKPHLSTAYFVIGLGQMALGLMIGMRSPMGFLFVPAGALMIWLSRAFATMNLIELRADAIVTRASPRAPTVVIPYRGIVRIEKRLPTLVEVHLADRMVKVYLAALRKEDADVVVATLERKALPPAGGGGGSAVAR
jgi:hypothetical protein